MPEPSAPEVNTAPRVPEFKIPPIGTHVYVERGEHGSGNIENNWSVLGQDPLTKRVQVIAPDPTDSTGERVLIKNVRSEDFIRLNPIPGIIDVETYEQLEAAIDRVSFVLGTEIPGRPRTEFTPEYLKAVLFRYKNGAADITEITRAGGLRDAVKRILGEPQPEFKKPEPPPPISNPLDPRDYYKALGLDPMVIRSSADPQRDILQAYRQASQQNHPDHGGDTKAQAKINVAYGFLKDVANRSAYGIN